MVKVLFCGDIEGRINDVVERVNKVNGSKAGPFDVLFCIGKLLNENNSIQIDSNTKFPFPAYIIPKDDVIDVTLKGQLESVPNLNLIMEVGYLHINDLSILCVPGAFDESHFNNESDVSSAYYRKSQIDLVVSSIPSTGIDFVLSAEWAYGLLNRLDPSKYPSMQNCMTVGSAVISDLLRSTNPRYHFAGSQNIFYERLPYRSANGDITRMICLGPVRAATDKSRKWLHALSVQPRMTMNETDLRSVEGICSESPFESLKREDNDRMTTDAKRSRNDNSSGSQSNYRFASQLSSRPSCWFCLASPDIEKQLIVSVSEGAYLAVPKGQLTPQHILIIPVIHRQSSIQLPEEAIEDIERMKQAVVKMFREQGKAILMWERNLTTRNPVHCHLQVIPIDPMKISVVKIVLDAAATQRGFRFTEIPTEISLSTFAGQDDYLYTEVYGVSDEQPKRYGYVVRDRRPNMQFFHQAVGSLLETENLGEDWKDLQKSKEEEAAITDKVRETFKPYDFTLKEEKS